MLKKIRLILAIFTVLCSAASSADPALSDGQWRGSVHTGVSLASGNTEATNVNVGAEAARATEINKLNLYFTGLYGTQDNTMGSRTETANLARAGAKYDHNLSARNFGFSSLDLEHDKLQRLDLRTVAGGGLGYHVIKTDNETFDLFSGLAYNREAFVDVTRESIELLLAEESSHKITDNTSFKQRFALYPNLKESGEYRSQLDATLATTIIGKIGLQLTLSSRYQSNPQPGIKNTDVLFLTNVTYKFGAQ